MSIGDCLRTWQTCDFDESCTFSHDFQGPQRTENNPSSKLLTSWNMPFFGQRFGRQHVDFGGYLGEPFAAQKLSRMTSEKVMKNEAPKRADLGPGGGASGAGSWWGTLARVVKHIFVNSEHLTREGPTNGPG